MGHLGNPGGAIGGPGDPGRSSRESLEGLALQPRLVAFGNFRALVRSEELWGDLGIIVGTFWASVGCRGGQASIVLFFD